VDRWVFHIKWSHKPDGLLEVWKDGKLCEENWSEYLQRRKGPFKMGIYKPHWKSKPKRSKTTKQSHLLDEVRVGNASASYKAGVPRSRPASP